MNSNRQNDNVIDIIIPLREEYSRAHHLLVVSFLPSSSSGDRNEDVGNLVLTLFDECQGFTISQLADLKQYLTVSLESRKIEKCSPYHNQTTSVFTQDSTCAEYYIKLFSHFQSEQFDEYDQVNWIKFLIYTNFILDYVNLVLTTGNIIENKEYFRILGDQTLPNMFFNYVNIAIKFLSFMTVDEKNFLSYLPLLEKIYEIIGNVTMLITDVDRFPCYELNIAAINSIMVPSMMRVREICDLYQTDLFNSGEELRISGDGKDIFKDQKITFDTGDLTINVVSLNEENTRFSSFMTTRRIKNFLKEKQLINIIGNDTCSSSSSSHYRTTGRSGESCHEESSNRTATYDKGASFGKRDKKYVEQISSRIFDYYQGSPSEKLKAFYLDNLNMRLSKKIYGATSSGRTDFKFTIIDEKLADPKSPEYVLCYMHKSMFNFYSKIMMCKLISVYDNLLMCRLTTEEKLSERKILKPLCKLLYSHFHGANISLHDFYYSYSAYNSLTYSFTKNITDLRNSMIDGKLLNCSLFRSIAQFIYQKFFLDNMDHYTFAFAGSMAENFYRSELVTGLHYELIISECDFLKFESRDNERVKLYKMGRVRNMRINTLFYILSIYDLDNYNMIEDDIKATRTWYKPEKDNRVPQLIKKYMDELKRKEEEKEQRELEKIIQMEEMWKRGNRHRESLLSTADSSSVSSSDVYSDLIFMYSEYRTTKSGNRKKKLKALIEKEEESLISAAGFVNPYDENVKDIRKELKLKNKWLIDYQNLVSFICKIKVEEAIALLKELGFELNIRMTGSHIIIKPLNLNGSDIQKSNIVLVAGNYVKIYQCKVILALIHKYIIVM